MKIWELEIGKKYTQDAYKDSNYFIDENRKLLYIRNSEILESPIRYNLLVEIDFEEFIEPIKFTDIEKGFFKIIGINYNYITKDENNELWFYRDLPIKKSTYFISTSNIILRIPFLDSYFKIIKPMDCYKISDLVGDI